MSTIYALATAPGRAAVAVVRCLGPHTAHIYRCLTGASRDPTPRLLLLRKLYHPHTHALLDEALTLFFQGPRLYTGEDSLELHLHGGTAVVSLVLRAIGELHAPQNDVVVRYAEPGEFTRRAFQQGKLDLTEAEGVVELIDAQTELQRAAAMASATGTTRAVFSEWRKTILNQMALLTAVIDFGEDHSLEEVDELFDRVGVALEQLSGEVRALLAQARLGELLHRGFRVVLLGPPNAGKLLLLNRLARRDAAIVSAVAGTTRDAIDVPLEINGYKVVVGDTAGIRDHSASADPIEHEGIRRALAKLLECDLALAVIPASGPLPDALFANHLRLLQKQGTRVVCVVNKQDTLVPGTDHASVVAQFAATWGVAASSVHLVLCVSGHGLRELVDAVGHQFRGMVYADTHDPVRVSLRAVDILEHDVLHGLEQFEEYRQVGEVVLAAESLRYAVEGIGKITGEAVGIEEVLGVVFSRFCIGK